MQELSACPKDKKKKNRLWIFSASKDEETAEVLVLAGEKGETHAALLLWLWALACLALPPRGDD